MDESFFSKSSLRRSKLTVKYIYISSGSSENVSVIKEVKLISVNKEVLISGKIV